MNETPDLPPAPPSAPSSLAPPSSPPPAPASPSLAPLSGGGAMGALMRSIDWSRTAVGDVATWPQSLRTALSILLDTGFPMYIAWGRDFTQFYNDGYRPILGSTKHPAAMGISTRETFAEIWNIIGPMFDGVMQGNAIAVTDFLLPLDRHGFVEECYFIFSYSPIREESGSVGGVLVTVTETTERVLGERRLETLRLLASRTADTQTPAEACERAGQALAANPADIPFALLYLFDGDQQQARLAAASGLEAGSAACPTLVDLVHGADACPWPLAAVAHGDPAITLDALPPLGALPAPYDQAPPRRALVLPIARPGEARPAGVLVAGLTPRLSLDGKYQSFLELVSGQIATAIASARAFQEAEARVAALAELDRAKTTFFSNVSHEFRTPLALMLGPLEDALASGRGLDGDSLDMAHRNALRLLKLVNSLLDFSRIEAGRVQASYEPLDLAALTADLASQFRSATARAGVALLVDCPPLPQPVYVDREMWEKIVLNLLSNAFKFTFAGEIAVTLAARGDRAELTVRDSGIGVPEEEVPRLFERFHRVEGARSRTHEGSGIGLALVAELVKMHGGTVQAESRVDVGTRFTISIPFGAAHLPRERIGAARAAASTALGAAPFVEEALRWLPSPSLPDEDENENENAGAVGSATAQTNVPFAGPAAGAVSARIILADDNADMRDYVRRLLSPYWSVEAVSDGAAALADVMMPGLDGYQLLAALRAEPRLRAVPLILLSARAGEEARLEAIGAGAEDYVVKPFSARELVARVRAQIEIAHAQRLIKQNAEAERRRLYSFLMDAPAAIAVLRGPELIFELANERYLQIVGKRDILGKAGRRALPELSAQGVWDLFDRIYQTGEPYVGNDFPAQIARGTSGVLEQGYFNWVGQATYGSDGNIDGVMLFAIEVTEQVLARRQTEQARALEQELRRAAESANRAKDEFLAMLGHELRNPLAPILTALQLMRLRGDSSSLKERAIIERQMQHVVSLVDDLLDVSRITRGKVELKRERVELAQVVAKAIEIASPLLEQRHHALEVAVPRVGLLVDADPLRLAQVISNLLNNAAKYTEPHGRIRVAAEADGAQVALRVRDSGIGIAPQMLPHIFDLFVQERQAIDRSQGGLGLGLAIVRSLVELHGGSVSVHSAGKKQGSEFVVCLPLVANVELVLDEDEAHGAAVEPRPDARRILVVDDNSDAADLLAESLRTMGHRTAVAYDGPQALELAARFEPEVALLDIGLPVMDGYELAHQLKLQAGDAPLYLVAITGYGQESDRQRSQAVGFHHHLVKPINLTQVDSLLDTLVPPTKR